MNELRTRRRKLETDILDAVAKLYEEFKAGTGISPDYISIDLENVTAHDDPEPVRVVTDVDVYIRL
jgi:hypothetical protein